MVGFATPDDDTGRSMSCSDEFLEGFTPADLADDLEGYYVNLHSEAFPAGAVRGQLPVGTRIDAADVTSTWSIAADPDQVVGAGGEPGATASLRADLRQRRRGGLLPDHHRRRVRRLPVAGGHGQPHPRGTGGPGRPAAGRVRQPGAGRRDDPDGVRTSSGCAVTPQFTGTAANGVDNGRGATLADIEADPADYYVDVHTEGFAPGAVRGQFADPFVVTSRTTVSADALQVVGGGELGATGTWDLRMDRTRT